jgi:acetyl esterase/lipase
MPSTRSLPLLVCMTLALGVAGPAPAASFAVVDIGVQEGNNGLTTALVQITLSPMLSVPASVDYETLPGTAQPNSDYVPTRGTLVFEPGEFSKMVAIPIVADTVPETDEYLLMTLSNPMGGDIGRAQARLVIYNDDPFYTLQEGIEYANVGGRSLQLDVYQPTGATKPTPLVVWLHIGSWFQGSRYPTNAVREAKRGYAVASIDYRLSGEAPFPAQIQDVKAAIRFLRANAQRFNIDPSRIAVWGMEAGGHLAALAGTSGDVAALDDPSEGNPTVSSRVQGVVDWAGQLNLPALNADALPCSGVDHNAADSFESQLIRCALPSCPDRAAAASPSSYVSADDPPFLIVHGDADCNVSPQQAVNFANQLRAAGVDVKLVLGEGVTGAGSPYWWSRETPGLEVDAFLDRIFAAPPAPAAPARLRTARH